MMRFRRSAGRGRFSRRRSSRRRSFSRRRRSRGGGRLLVGQRF